ncbi:MAG: NAD(P)-dependent oxidoreductase [Sphingomonadaceae bacterium]
MILALTGATGFVGSTLIEMAGEAGLTVKALTRRKQPPRAHVEWVQGDLSNKAALARLVEDAEAVLHVAGVVSAPDAAGFEEGNVTGTLNLIEAATSVALPRFVFVSSLSAREPEISQYGASKARAEKLVMASGLDWTIVRPPWVFGPGDRDTLDMFKAARWGLIPTPEEGRVSMIHVEDLSRLLLALLPGGEEVTGQVFEPDDGRADGWSHYEMARAIGFAMGGRPKVLGLSRKTMERAAKVDGFVRRSKAKLTLDRAAYFSHPDWVVSADARPPAGRWTPRIETRDGLKATAAWYRAERWL